MQAQGRFHSPKLRTQYNRLSSLITRLETQAAFNDIRRFRFSSNLLGIIIIINRTLSDSPLYVPLLTTITYETQLLKFS